MAEQRRLRRIRRHYDASAGRYDAAMAGGLTERLTRRGRRGVGETVQGRLLEVGIGTGLSLPFYPSQTAVVGIDLSPGMLQLGRQRAAQLGRSVELLRADAQRLPFADASFDSVAFNLCLCTVPDAALAVREAVRVARPGAGMAFLEHVRSHLWPIALLQELINPLTVLVESDHFNRRTADTVRQAGVEVVSVERWALGFFTLIRGRAPLP